VALGRPVCPRIPSKPGKSSFGKFHHIGNEKRACVYGSGVESVLPAG
jgi:hypothetical protein